MTNHVVVDNPRVRYTNRYIESDYEYPTTKVHVRDGNITVVPQNSRIVIRTERRVPRIGLMIIGWGGRIGSTLTAALLANRLGLSWHLSSGQSCTANYLGSWLASSVTSLGIDEHGGEILVPFSKLLPVVDPNDLILDGWDICSSDLAAAMERAGILDSALQDQLRPHVKNLKPRPSIYASSFLNSNTKTTLRADNILRGTKRDQMEQIRKDIREFRAENHLDRVILVWTANSEKSSSVFRGFNDTSDNLMRALKADNSEISPSTLFAVAAILEGCAFINGASQNTFVPGCIELALKHNVFIAGDDFESAPAKLSPVLQGFLTSAGLSAHEVSRSSLSGDSETPSHRDEIALESMLGGRDKIQIERSTEDTLFATPVLLDLILLTELCQRITFRTHDESSYSKFHPVLSVLNCFCKVALRQSGIPVPAIGHRSGIENLLRACVGLPVVHHLRLEHWLKNPQVLSRREAPVFSQVVSMCKSHDTAVLGSAPPHICSFAFASDSVLTRT